MGYRCGVMMKKKWGRMNSEREREWLPLNVDNQVNSLEILRKLKLMNTEKKNDGAIGLSLKVYLPIGYSSYPPISLLKQHKFPIISPLRKALYL